MTLAQEVSELKTSEQAGQEIKKEFWALARAAIAKGLLTDREARIIARVGHRKERYWDRHLRDLKVILLGRGPSSGLPLLLNGKPLA